jgi:cytochrome c2
MKPGFGLIAAVVLPACTLSPRPAPRPIAAGERAWAKCLACHSLEPGRDDHDGPTLHRILGRRVATAPRYDYSPALLALARRQPRWTRAGLDAFLADPQRMAPGNRMGYFGMSDHAERSALIAWLARGER